MAFTWKKQSGNVEKNERRVVVISAVSVGTTYIYALMHTGDAVEIALIDLEQKPIREEVEVMDLEQGLAFVQLIKIRPADRRHR